MYKIRSIPLATYYYQLPTWQFALAAVIPDSGIHWKTEIRITLRGIAISVDYIYTISGARKMAMDLVRSMEKSGSSAPQPRPPVMGSGKKHI